MMSKKVATVACVLFLLLFCSALNVFAEPETACFDGVDNDGDGFIDCADSDCNGATDGECQTGNLGICAAGTYTCGERGEKVCMQNNQATDETLAAGNCEDGLDNDCDGLTDIGADPDCASVETACFDGIDNDNDGNIDCADSDCAGKTDGECQTGKPGICAAGTFTCDGGAKVCKQNNQATPETLVAVNCNDSLDNDCDGFTDCADSDCECGMVLAKIDIDPTTLNIKSAGQYITAYIELTEPNNAGQIDFGSVELKDGDVFVATMLSKPVGMADPDSLMVKFDHAKVIDYLIWAGKTSGSIEFTITGTLSTGETFMGHSTVRIINPVK